MKLEDIKEGMDVLIEKSDMTQMKFGFNSTMRKMVGKVYRVREAKNGCTRIDVENWNWHVDDLQPAETKKRENSSSGKQALFDPNDLDI